MPTKAELEREVRILRTKLADFDKYKTRVREVAQEKAKEQGWCRSGLNEALEELDIPPVPSYMRRTAVITVTYTYDPEDCEDGEFAQIGLMTPYGSVDHNFEIEEWETEYEDPEEVYDE